MIRDYTCSRQESLAACPCHVSLSINQFEAKYMFHALLQGGLWD